MTEATHFSQCVHDQQRRLEAEDCDSIRCAQLIGASESEPHTNGVAGAEMRNILYNWASVSEPHTCDFNATFTLYIYIYVICYISICDRHCTSNIAINISIFHLGLIRGARAYCPDAARRGAVGPTHC